MGRLRAGRRRLCDRALDCVLGEAFGAQTSCGPRDRAVAFDDRTSAIRLRAEIRDRRFDPLGCQPAPFKIGGDRRVPVLPRCERLRSRRRDSRVIDIACSGEAIDSGLGLVSVDSAFGQVADKPVRRVVSTSERVGGCLERGAPGRWIRRQRPPPPLRGRPRLRPRPAPPPPGRSRPESPRSAR